MLKKLYFTSKPIFQKWNIQLKFVRENAPILIYQMGKVGSSSIYHSLKSQISSRTIYHFHSIHPNVVNGHKANNQKFIQSGEYHRILGTAFQELMYKRINSGKEKFDIITLVREPLTRNISAFFQNAYRWIPNFEQKCLDNELNTKEVVNYFFSKKQFHTRGLNWLSREIGEVLGINVYAEPFPRNKGYQIFENQKCRLLLIRMENLSVQSHVIREFLDLDRFELINANVGNQKYYSEAYKNFKKTIKFPDILQQAKI